MCPLCNRCWTFSNNNPFGTFEIVNVTKRTSTEDIFPGKVPNFRKHPIRFSIYEELDFSLQDEIFRGVVIEKFNATMHAIIKNFGAENKAESDMFLFVQPLDQAGFAIYPHQLTQSVMMISYGSRVIGFAAILKNVTSKNIFGYALIVIVVSCFVLTVSTYTQTRKFLLFETITDVLNLLMNDNGNIRYQQLRLAHIMIIVPLTFIGCVVVNGVLSLVLTYAIYHVMKIKYDHLMICMNHPF